MQTRPLHLKGMGGLGDNVYQRPLVAHLAKQQEVWISTPYPELYEDLPVHPVRWAGMSLRCQGKNMRRVPLDQWTRPPSRSNRVRLHYALRDLRHSIVAEMEQRAMTRVRPFRFDLPDFGPPIVEPPYALVRPVSVRGEWMNTARNPKPEYIAAAAELLRAQGMTVICVADLDPESEWPIGELPEADHYWIRGELTTREIFALVKHATVVVGGVGWIVPTCLAYQTPSLIIGGGLGGHNSPSVLIDGRMSFERMRFLLPTPYCLCRDNGHDCPKEIPEFETHFLAQLAALTS